MNSNNELAIKMETAARKRVESGYWTGENASTERLKVYKDTLGILSPGNIMALLEERDADKKRITELEAISAAAKKLVRCKGRYHSEQNYRALAALFGVTTPELPPLEGEAQTVSVKLPDDVLSRLEHEANHVTAWHHMDEHSCKVNRRDLLTLVSACRAAGINLEVVE